ncbi:lipase member H-like [Hyalella azteca]|uniref:Lipase member H-like n=1 Tax=Hyalella azteca TaxID=294128 RepID=A0A8B7PIM7_HYAAZ|nr:lipase member H-like [Hyalella azteca]
MAEPIGHLDFYPNGGGSQPGCSDHKCSHSRAHQLFIESVRVGCFFPVAHCNSTSSFSEDCWICNTRFSAICTRMGFWAQHMNMPPKSKIFVETKFSPPYCGPFVPVAAKCHRVQYLTGYCPGQRAFGG